MMTLSKFRSGIRNDLRKELFVRGVDDLEHAYQIVRDLDASRGSYYQRGSEYKSRALELWRIPAQKQPNSSTLTRDLKGKSPAESVTRANPRTQCFKYQTYGEVLSK